jgi:hypothetical protein
MRVVGAGLALLIGVLGDGLGSAAAQGNIELGPFRILGTLKLSGTYDDNILLTPNREIDDFVWTISPGVAVELPARRYALRLAYLADILRYTDHDEFDTVHHSLQAEGQYSFPWGLGLRLSDRFLITDEFAGFPVPELTGLVDRTENTLEVGASYTLRERYTLDLNYKWFLVDYEDRFNDLDREDHTIAGTLFYRVLPKTSVLGEVNYVRINYDDPVVAQDRDSEGWRFKVGLRGDLTAKTSAILKVGWEFKDYDNPRREDWDGLIVEAEVIWRYRDPSEVRLFGGRANYESTFEGNNFLVSTFGGAEIRHFLTRRLVVRIRGLAGVNDYPERVTIGTKTDKRSDTFYQIGASLRYEIRRWLAVEFGYDRLLLDSNFGEFDYTVNRVKGSIVLTY